jgi:subfamily B ATP-binding cassette protein MsbA
VEQLSGLKQRLINCLCRFENPPIMILDEATSALDTESEIKVSCLENMMQNRTSIDVTPSSYHSKPDSIIVMQKGKIVELVSRS